MVTIRQRTFLILLLLLTAIILTGYFTAPPSCCTIQENLAFAGDADCLVCTLQVGLWSPQIVTVNPHPGIVFDSNDNPLKILDLEFQIHHPPII